MLRKIAFVLTVLTMSSLLVHSPAAQSGGQSGKFGWLADYDEARALAKKTGKPMMVVFRCVP